MAIEHIVFDLGNVLIGWDPRRLYEKEFDTHAEVDYFLEHVCANDWNLQMDGGRPFHKAIAERQVLFPRYAEQIGWWKSRWAEMIGGEMPATVAILNRLHARGTSLYALTNWSAETFPYARANFSCLAKFKNIVVSGEEKMTKPDLALYQRAAARWGIDPASILFIDDSQKNVDGAIAAGWNAEQFTDAAALEKNLITRGLL